MKDADWVPVGVAVLGAVASLIVAWITARVAVSNAVKAAGTSVETNNKTLFVNAITAERAKWRQELRLATAEFVRLAHEGLAAEPGKILPKLNEHRVLILLRVNPNPKHATDAAIIAAVQAIPELVRDSNKAEALARLTALETSVQTLLKAEWEKSKLEAISGKLQLTNTIHATRPRHSAGIEKAAPVIPGRLNRHVSDRVTGPPLPARSLPWRGRRRIRRAGLSGRQVDHVPILLEAFQVSRHVVQQGDLQRFHVVARHLG